MTTRMRRGATLTLPHGDADSDIIAAWLESLPKNADKSKELRRVIVAGLTMGAGIERIERMLREGSFSSATQRTLTPEESTLIDALMDFG